MKIAEVFNLFSNCFWIQFPETFPVFKIEGYSVIYDHYGDGLYMVEWNDDYVGKDMEIILEGEVILFFDELFSMKYEDGMLELL